MNAKHDLAEALCQLLETKTLEKITVKDIVARCGVNRQTFYYHFHDVYDLMRWIFDREAANLAQTVREAGGDWRQELRTITDVLRSKRHLVMNAYRSVNRRDLERYLMQGYGPVIRRIVEQAAVVIREQLFTFPFLDFPQTVVYLHNSFRPWALFWNLCWKVMPSIIPLTLPRRSCVDRPRTS